MKVLVTGAAGFIGSHLVQRLLRDGHEVTGFDNFSTGHRRNLERIGGEIRFIEGDLRNEDQVRRATESSELVYHLAALASVPLSIAEPKLTFDVNVTGTLNLLTAAQDAGVRRLVFASSSSVYGDPAVTPTPESLTPRPLSPYAVSKLTGEHLCTLSNNLYGVETVVLRYFNVYGPYQDPNSPYAAVIPKFIRSLLMGEIPSIFGDGEQTRGFTYVDDVVDGNVLAGLVPEAAGAVMNLSSDRSVSVNQAFAAICTKLDRPMEAAYLPARSGEIRDSRADVALARELLGFESHISFEFGLNRTIETFRGERQAECGSMQPA